MHSPRHDLSQTFATPAAFALLAYFFNFVSLFPLPKACPVPISSRSISLPSLMQIYLAESRYLEMMIFSNQMFNQVDDVIRSDLKMVNAFQSPLQVSICARGTQQLSHPERNCYSSVFHLFLDLKIRFRIRFSNFQSIQLLISLKNAASGTNSLWLD